MTTSTRTKPLCTATTKTGQPCRGLAEADGLCRVHAGRVDVVAIGRKGGRARARKVVTLRDAIRRGIASNPEQAAKTLLASSRGVELASRILDAEEREAKQREAATNDVPLAEHFSFRSLLVVAARAGQDRVLLGFELTEEQRRELLEDDEGGEGKGAEADRRSPKEVPASVYPSERATVAQKTTPRPSDQAKKGTQPAPKISDSDTAVAEALARAVAQHAANRRELGLEPDDGNDDRTVGRFPLVDV